MRILVTGGAGYVGAQLVPLLLSEGHRVRVFDLFASRSFGLLSSCGHPNFELVQGDVGDEGPVRTSLRDVDAVIHLAAVVGHPACQREPTRAWSTNVEGTATLLELRKNDVPLIFASTGSVYGRVDSVCTEETPADPLTLYGQTKAAGEKAALAAGNVVVYRFATAFGVSPHMRFDLLPNDFVYQAVRQGSLVVYEREFRRTLIHVRDMARSMAFALNNWAHLRDDIFNIGNEECNISKGRLAERVRELHPCYVHFADCGVDPDQRNYEVSYDKIQSRGFRAQVSLDAGLLELLQAVQLSGSGR